MKFFTGRRQKGGLAQPNPPYRIGILTILLCTYLAACMAQPVGRTQSPLALPTASVQNIPITGSSTSCNSPAPLTVGVTQGPYFKAGSPEKTSLIEAGMQGTKLVLSGYVSTTDCKPVAHAQLDFWQADANGQYDNSGYTLRGHQFTDSAGHYQLTTIVPGLYTGRTEHIHVKVQAPGGPVLTTQLFFPGVAQNQSDGIFNPSLLMSVKNNSDGETAIFNFVISP